MADPCIASLRVAAHMAAHMVAAAHMASPYGGSNGGSYVGPYGGSNMLAHMSAHMAVDMAVHMAVAAHMAAKGRTTPEPRDKDWRRLQPTMGPYSREAYHAQARPARAFCVQTRPRRHAAMVLACRRNQDQTGGASSFGTGRERPGSKSLGSALTRAIDPVRLPCRRNEIDVPAMNFARVRNDEPFFAMREAAGE